MRWTGTGSLRGLFGSWKRLTPTMILLPSSTSLWNCQADSYMARWK